jgi:hypothetical protein
MPRAALGALGAIAAVLALGGLAAAPAAAAPDEIIVTVPEVDGATAIDNAQLRWGLNTEAGAGAFAGGCNFLSAGKAGDAGGSRVWEAGDGLYSARSGAVRIEKPDAAGQWRSASFETRCLDPQGRAVTTSSTTSASGNQVVIDGGTGRVLPGAGLEIRWEGSFTVVFYGGMTYWSVTDPVLTVDASGSGRLIGTASGYGASMDDTTKWATLPARSIVLAEVRRVDTSGAGFAVVPEYLGVAASGGDQVERTAANAAYWGSFPQDFLDYQSLTGQRAYWLTSGGVRDPAKPATAMYVSYDASAPVGVPAPGADGTGGATADTPSNPLRMPPGLAAPNEVPTVPTVPVGAGAPTTTLPQRQGLVPGALAAVSPVVLPLLGATAALGASIVAVLSLMQALPWQRRVGG